MDAADIFYKLSAGAKFQREKSKKKEDKECINKDAVIGKTVVTHGENHEGATKDAKRKEKLKNSISNGEMEQSKQGSIKLFKNTLVSDNSDNCAQTKNIKRKLKPDGTTQSSSSAKQIRKQEVAEMRNKLHISVSGKNIPHPIQDFEELNTKYGVSNVLIKNLMKSGFNTPTPIQMQAIPPMLEGRHIMACAPTGSGKTIAFLIPIMHHLKKPTDKGYRAVIVCPTRELARQTYRESIRISEGTDLRINIISKVKKTLGQNDSKKSKKFDLLITTPNRLVYLLNQDPPQVNLKSVEWLVIDESDKLFETGVRGFRDQLAVIYNACESVKVKRAMFSATQTPLLTKWCRKNLKDLILVNVGVRNSAVSSVHQELLFVGNEQGKLLAIRDLIRKGVTPPVLVFVQTKERAQELFNELVYDGINVDVIHSDRSQLQRDNVIRGFREGKIWILICTELMGRGIDFKGVSLVVNYDFPPSTVSYIHRIGRTGRAGRPGRAITYFTHDDEINLRNIAYILKSSGCSVPDFMLKLKKSNKRDLKRLASRALKREAISTTPIYQKFYERKERRKRKLAREEEKNNESRKKIEINKMETTE